jgi:hypothetical protein
MLLEVSQLLTAVTSPVTPIEEQDGDATLQVVRYAERGAVHGTPLKLRETLPDAKSFHNALLNEARRHQMAG